MAQQINPDQLYNDILQRLNQNRAGTYGEGSVRQAINEFKGLDDMVKSGSLSQRDYVGIADKIKQYVQPIGQASTSGSGGATALTQAGWYDIQNNFRNADIYREATNMLGRDLTQNEFAQLAPYFGTGNPRDVEAGRAALASYAEQQKKTPQALQSQAGQYSGDVNSIFNDLLKRGASQDEVNHFGSLLASGQVDAYTLKQFVSQLPEYTQAQDKTERGRLNTELSGYDQDFFNRAKEDVISRYSKAGIQNSPSLDFALTNLMGDIQKQRSQYIAGLAREDYTRGRDVQRQDYGASMDQMLADKNYGRQRSDNYSDLLLNRSFASQDYQRQQDDLMRLLSGQQGQRRSGSGGFLGGLAGAGIGGFLGGPMGASTGYQIGQGAGTYWLDR